MAETTKKSFLKSAAILGIAGLLVQVMGAIFRIPLGNIIGDEGMGYYQTAYPVYVALLVFSTNGAPAAISKMTSERIATGHYKEAHRVFKLSFELMAVFGLVLSVTLFAFAKPIVSFFGDPGAYYAMLTIAPALLFVPIMAVFRGYFQGMQEMGPTATSQLIEQAVRVIVGLTLAIVLVSRGLDMAAAGATLGTSIGPVFGIITIYIIYLKRRARIMENVNADEHTEEESKGSILKTLALIAIPITIGVSILPVMNIGDLAVVMRRLQDIGYTTAEANALYGQLTGMAIPVVNVPMALALSMALAIVPAIAAANASKDEKALAGNIRLGMRTAMIIGVPCSLGIIAIAEPIMTLLYPLQHESAVSAAACLAILGFGIVFLCVGQTMAGVLQGLGRPGLAVWSLAIGFLVKCISSYILTGIPALNVTGAAWGSVLGFATIGIFNFIAARKITGIRHDVSLAFVRPVASGLLMFAAVKLSYFGLARMGVQGTLSTLIVLCIAVAVYGLAILKLKAITVQELESFPKGTKLAKIVKKLHLG